LTSPTAEGNSKIQILFLEMGKSSISKSSSRKGNRPERYKPGGSNGAPPDTKKKKVKRPPAANSAIGESKRSKKRPALDQDVMDEAVRATEMEDRPAPGGLEKRKRSEDGNTQNLDSDELENEEEEEEEEGDVEDPSSASQSSASSSKTLSEVSSSDSDEEGHTEADVDDEMDAAGARKLSNLNSKSDKFKPLLSQAYMASQVIFMTSVASFTKSFDQVFHTCAE